MTYYTFMGEPEPTVRWIYGLEIDHDVIERIDNSLSLGIFRSPSPTLSSSPFSDYGLFADDLPSGPDPFDDQLARVTDFLRSEYGAIGALGAWDPDVPSKERKVVIAVHAHGTPRRTREKREVLARVERVRKEVVPDAKRRAKWYHSSEAGVWKTDVRWEERPEQFIRFH